MKKHILTAMDYKMHDTTYANFIKGIIYAGIFCIILVIITIVMITT